MSPRRPHRWLFSAFALVATTALVGCSGNDGSTPTSGDATAEVPDDYFGEGVDMEEVDWVEVDVPPEVLEPPKAVNRNLELQEKAARTLTFCHGWGQIRGEREPSAYDYDELIKWGNLGFARTGLIDAEKPFPNTRRLGGGGPSTIEVPREVRDALLRVRSQFYRFTARLNFAKSFRDQKYITEEQFVHRVDLAFLHLASEEYSDAERLIERFYIEHC